MNFKLFTTVAAASLAMVGSAAYAQDASNFGGLKAGVIAGYDDVQLAIEDVDTTAGGFLYGVTAGYDYDLGTAVIGLETEATLSTARNDLGGESDGFIGQGRDFYVGARVGFPVTSSVLLYAKAGYTNSRVELGFGAESDVELIAGKNLHGYRVGGGVEYVNAAKFGRLEYRYSDYDAADAGFPGLDSRRHQVVVAAGVRF